MWVPRPRLRGPALLVLGRPAHTLDQPNPHVSPAVRPLERFVDIHCHMLPGLDDGAHDWQESLAMAQLAVQDGIGLVVVTPHQLGNFAHNRGELIRQRTREFQGLLDHHGLPLRVVPGADVRIEPELLPKLRAGEVLTLADRGRYVLLELPHEVYFPLERLLGELERAGMVGILSHPRAQSRPAPPGGTHRRLGPRRLLDAAHRRQSPGGPSVRRSKSGPNNSSARAWSISWPPTPTARGRGAP